MLQRAYERLMAHALLDSSFGAELLVDARTAALSAGYSPLLAESLVGLRAETLGEFADALHRRVYGRPADPPPTHRSPQRRSNTAIAPLRMTIRG